MSQPPPEDTPGQLARPSSGYYEEPLPSEGAEASRLDLQHARRSQVPGFLSIHAGPLPHPSTLRAYQELVPDAPERFFSMLERDQAHEHKQEDHMVAGSERRADRGQLLGFASFAICVLAGVGCAALHESSAAIAAFAAAGSGVIITLITGKWEQDRAAGKGQPHRTAAGESDSAKPPRKKDK